MSFSITETDVWPRLREKIAAERARRIADLLFVSTLEAMRMEQGFVQALDWVLEEARPRPLERE